MGLVSKPYTFANDTTADATEVNSDVDTLYTLVNGNLDSENLAAAAVGATELADNAVNFNKVDWGTGANQVRGTETTSWRLGQGLANYLDIASPALTGNRTWTLQDGDDTFVGRATTDTLTNKTLTSPTLTGTVGGAATYTTPTLSTPVIGSFASATHNHLSAAGGGTLSFVPPIGTIIPFYDFNALVTFDTNYWRYCDGSVLAYVSSPLDGQALPDLSNRYLVGFGTEGGGDIDTAVWAIAATGAASHQINVQHSHTVASHAHTTPTHAHTLSGHTHSGASHAHTVNSHTHGLSSSGFALLDTSSSASSLYASSVGSGTWSINRIITGVGTDVSSGSKTYGVALGGSTDAQNPVTDSAAGTTGTPSVNSTDTSGSGTSGSAAPATDNQLSTSQSIQPRSIRVRFIMRVL